MVCVPCVIGSPPHMRGKVQVQAKPSSGQGITPAHAGKSCGQSLQERGRQDHPRTCGEKLKGKQGQKQAKGSPPHMRGKVPSPEKGEPTLRITPAHAGKRPASPRARRGRRDHPRTCGEKRLRRQCARRSKGLPPHMRGKEVRANIAALGRGITPAHAGKSSTFFRAPAGTWDHPRTCGEKRRVSVTA